MVITIHVTIIGYLFASMVIAFTIGQLGYKAIMSFDWLAWAIKRLDGMVLNGLKG